MIETSPLIDRFPIKSLICIWIIACFLALYDLGNVPLRDFDEATVARVALELTDKSGLERFLPSLWNYPYLNKPPGLHWFISLAIQWNRFWRVETNFLPSEFCIRFFPAILSTFVVPIAGLIQWNLRPKDKISAIASSVILLTLLPIVRHGRLAMLDGTQLSAIALLWFFLVSLDESRLDKFRFLGAGFACSFMLLLKAPLMIPALVAALLPLVWEKKFKRNNSFYFLRWFSFGLIPGVLWHCWNIFANGSGALWLWWGDGAGRVLFQSGPGSNLGFWVPVIEVLEGGWPWILLWPFGVALAWSQMHTRWGAWTLSTQIVLLASILPLKMQLPWYSHSIWLPFSLLCGPPISYLVERNSLNCIPGKKLLGLVPACWSCLGGVAIAVVFISFFELNSVILPYRKFIIPISIGWFVGGLLLNNRTQKYRRIGLLSVALGSLIGLFFLMGSNLWLWELNENWQVKQVAKMVLSTSNEDVYIFGSVERPSLNWYAGKQVKSIESVQGVQLFLKRHYTNNPDLNKQTCSVIDNQNEWDLVRCQSE